MCCCNQRTHPSPSSLSIVTTLIPTLVSPLIFVIIVFNTNICFGGTVSPNHTPSRMSTRKRKADDDGLDDNMSISPQNSPAFAPRAIARPSKKVRANEVTGRPLSLPRLLETLDAQSLRSVLQT